MTLPLLAFLVLGAALPPDIDHALAKSFFDEANALSKADGGKLWGVPLAGPLLFVDPRTLRVVTNQADAEGKLTKEGEVWVGQLPDSEAPANHDVHWAGVHWTMVMWPLPELPHSRGRLMMHECFHRIQESLGLPASNPNCSHLDDKDGRIWMRLEMRALAEALSNTGNVRNQAIKDALAFRSKRYELCGIKVEDNERLLELNEGLAEYTGLVLSGYGKPSLESRAAMKLEQEQANPTFARSFAYATGPAYGLLLDSYGAHWRTELKPLVSLPLLLSLAANVARANRDKANERMATYGGTRVVEFETAQAVAREQKIAGFKKLFVDGPVLDLPTGTQFSFSYDPNGVDSFPGVGQVFGTAKITDEWGVLEVASGGVLMKRPKELITGVAVPMPKEPTPEGTSGDGWKLKLNPGWKIVEGSRKGDWTVAKGN